MSSRRCLYAVVLAVTLVWSGSAPQRVPAQGGDRPGANAEQPGQTGPQVQVGRVLSMEAKGKQYTLKFESTDGETYDLKLTPTVQFSVVGPGETAFLKPGTYITARGVMSEEKVFLTKVTVHVAPKTRKMPPGRIQKVEQVGEGESLATYDVAGEVVAVGPAPDYPEYTAVALKVGGRVPPVWLEPSHQVEIASANPEHAAAGADLEFITRKVGSRQIPTAVRVQHPAAFTAAELFGEDAAN